MNVFSEFYETGRITNLDELKKVFRILAKKIHPDVIGIEKANSSFIKLKDDFDYYVEIVKRDEKEKINQERYSRQEIIELLIEIEATGFLLNDNRIKKSNQYKARLVRFNRILKYLDIENVNNIFFIEKALCLLKIENRDTYENIKLIFYNVVSFHYEPRLFIKKSTAMLNDEIQKFKNKEKYKELFSFLSWLVKDMEFGSVFNNAKESGI